MTQPLLPFELDQRAEGGRLTAHGGVPLLIEAVRTSGAVAVPDASVVIKRRKRAWRRPKGCSLPALWRGERAAVPGPIGGRRAALGRCGAPIPPRG